MQRKTVHVAVGVIVNSNNQVLISKRAVNVHQGGLWEFPGGKVEPDEQISTALCRELNEELGIVVKSSSQLTTINHNYGDKSVCLHVYKILEFTGKPVGNEGQQIRWCDVSGLGIDEFPAANVSIINFLQLPDLIQITGNYSDLDELIKKTSSCITKGIKIIQFRAHDLDESEFVLQARAMLELCRKHDVKLILNRTPDLLKIIDVDGIHLSRHEMRKYSKRPVEKNKLFSVSCHNDEELSLAKKLETDYCFLSPVKQAVSHDAGVEIGFDRFSDLSKKYNCPVYALGGMTENDISAIQQHGGKGVAVISANWE